MTFCACTLLHPVGVAVHKITQSRKPTHAAVGLFCCAGVRETAAVHLAEPSTGGQVPAALVAVLRAASPQPPVRCCGTGHFLGFQI